MNKEQAIKKVWDSIGSIFTKEDVVALIEQIETEGTDIDVSELIEHVQESISNIDSSDIVDTSSAEFYLEGNQIQLETIDIDTNYIESEIADSINGFFNK
jgi:hypothetical protein